MALDNVIDQHQQPVEGGNTPEAIVGTESLVFELAPAQKAWMITAVDRLEAAEALAGLETVSGAVATEAVSIMPAMITATLAAKMSQSPSVANKTRAYAALTSYSPTDLTQASVIASDIMAMLYRISDAFKELEPLYDQCYGQLNAILDPLGGTGFSVPIIYRNKTYDAWTSTSLRELAHIIDDKELMYEPFANKLNKAVIQVLMAHVELSKVRQFKNGLADIDPVSVSAVTSSVLGFLREHRAAVDRVNDKGEFAYSLIETGGNNSREALQLVDDIYEAGELCVMLKEGLPFLEAVIDLAKLVTTLGK
ncbi:MAG: hypothetical protein PHN51_12105 [Candidatus Nanopelagicales bacterium]|nr:hypothetical protein [Candidatus Nanopelagicales bacterium]